MIYKVFAKILSIRIGKELPHLISENQGVFVKDIYIIDNTIIDIDILQYIYRRSSCNIALKLDMTKAFNRVGCPYLQHMLGRLKFLLTIVQLIMKCVSSTMISIGYKKSKTSYFNPTRGL